MSTNREGMVTTAQQDKLKRTVATTTDGITRSNILDLAGRTIAALRIGSGGDIITNASPIKYHTAQTLIVQDYETFLTMDSWFVHHAVLE